MHRILNKKQFKWITVPIVYHDKNKHWKKITKGYVSSFPSSLPHMHIPLMSKISIYDKSITNHTNTYIALSEDYRTSYCVKQNIWIALSSIETNWIASKPAPPLHVFQLATTIQRNRHATAFYTQHITHTIQSRATDWFKHHNRNRITTGERLFKW